MRRLRWPSGIPLALLVAAGLGCGPAVLGAPTPFPRSLDRVFILTPREEPPIEFGEPVVGTLSGLGAGFGRGVGYTLLVGVSGAAGGPYGLVASAFVAGIFGMVYIPVSTIGGAASAESAERLAEATAGLRTGMAELRANRLLGERLREAFRGLLGRELPLVEQDLDSATPAPVGADWLLEARILGIRNGSTWNMLTLDRPCELVVAAGIRLISVADGRAVCGRVAVFQSPVPRYTFRDWGAENGRRLKEAVAEACSVLAETLVEEAYLSTELPRRTR